MYRVLVEVKDVIRKELVALAVKMWFSVTHWVFQPSSIAFDASGDVVLNKRVSVVLDVKILTHQFRI